VNPLPSFLRRSNVPAHKEGGVSRCNLQRRGKKRDGGGLKKRQIIRSVHRLIGLVNLRPRTFHLSASVRIARILRVDQFTNLRQIFCGSVIVSYSDP